MTPCFFFQYVIFTYITHLEYSLIKETEFNTIFYKPQMMDNCDYQVPQLSCVQIIDSFGLERGSNVSVACGSFRLGDELPDPVQFTPDEIESIGVIRKSIIIEKKCMLGDNQKERGLPHWCYVDVYDTASLK